MDLDGTGDGPPPGRRRDEATPGGSRAARRRQRIGRYRLERVLGEGGFGRVYLARDEDLGRRGRDQGAAPPPRLPARGRRAFLTEARILASLDHPHIVPVYDVGGTEDGLLLRRLQVHRGQRPGDQMLQAARPSSAEAAELVATVAEALHYAHREGLVHRDIKPANILLDAGGQARTWPTSGWRCGRRTSARGQAAPARPPT